MQAIADNIWIVEGPVVKFMGLPYSTRMVVVRLPNNKLWVHSPVAFSESLQNTLSGLGEVAYLIAPNHLHHLFMGEWQQAYPNASSYGTAEVIKKRQDLTFTSTLNNSERYPWQNEVASILFTGSALMQECVFFHEQSHTLIVTDLIENFNACVFKPWQRVVAGWAGILAPNGKMPIDWRLSFYFHKQQAREYYYDIVAWQPQRIIMAHGEIVEENTVAFLQCAFRWLIR